MYSLTRANGVVVDADSMRTDNAQWGKAWLWWGFKQAYSTHLEALQSRTRSGMMDSKLQAMTTVKSSCECSGYNTHNGNMVPAHIYEKGIIKTKTKQLYSEKITFLLISNKYLRYLAPRSFPFKILRPYVPQVRIHRYRYKSIPTYIPYRAVPYMGMMCWYYSVTRNSPARFEEGLLIWI